ncbi:MAG: sulfotransferase [Acidobacteriaceae bacterium]|nr:sulfotransferase [Acidobacteriaceae bacterium]
MTMTGWIPYQISLAEDHPSVRWTQLGTTRLLEPFFEETLQKQLNQPFHQLFARQTSMDVLLELAETRSSLPLRGIVLHMSRCGSTLLSQMLAASPRNVVASEPSPLDAILRAQSTYPQLDHATHIRWIRAMAHALAQPRTGQEDAFYLKLDCWHLNQLALLREAFPEAPLLFLYREPLEVMVSHARMPAAWSIPGILHPLALSLKHEDWEPQHLERYAAKALANFCRNGLLAAEACNALLVNFTQLPVAVFGSIAQHFSLRLEDYPAMLAQSQRDAKRPYQPFTPDSEQKRAEASPQVQEATELLLRELYQQLEAAREAQERTVTAL